MIKIVMEPEYMNVFSLEDDWKDFHKRGLEFAHKVKKLLPKNVRLRYVAPFEDRSGIIDGEMWVE